MIDIGWFGELVVAVIASVIAITLHEAAHGYAALALGDDTARRAGRLSLNPIRHVDPVGTLILPGILLVGQLLTLGRVEGMIGWAKPVPVDPWRLQKPLTGMALIAAAGPAMNFGLAFVAALLVHPLDLLADWLDPVSTAWLTRFLVLSILVNLALGLFNLLPIPPLDGGRILVGILPRPLNLWLARTERYGFFIVLLLVFVLPQLIPDFNPVQDAMRSLVGKGVGLVLLLAGLR